MVLNEDGPIGEVGRGIGVHPGTLGNWVAVERVERGERCGVTAEERAELAGLRAECKQARVNRGLLKRLLAFWVKETSAS